jgi:hypothetical protein
MGLQENPWKLGRMPVILKAVFSYARRGLAESPFRLVSPLLKGGARGGRRLYPTSTSPYKGEETECARRGA